MQKDFETWLQVMVKQQTSGFSANSNSTVLNQSTASNFNGAATDAKVKQNLEDFYKARDAIYKDLK